MSVLPASSAGNQLSGVSSPSATSNVGAPITIGGLASGLNTNSIIQALLALDQQNIANLNNQESQVTQQETIYKQIQARLLTLQGDISQLGSSQNGVFDTQSATVSDTSVLTAAASSSAKPGLYTLQVGSLASAEQIASQGFASATSNITQGTFQIGLASGQSATITIDGSNNTLQGLADAINNANVGVAATVVNDGSGNSPFRLLLTSTQTGTSNAIVLTNGLGSDAGGAVKPDFQDTYVGQVSLGPNFTGTATPTANTGAGGYTGASNNTYTFTVVNGGTVGTDNNIQISYRDSTGANTGTLTVNSGNANQLLTVAQGIQVQFAPGTLVAGQTFSVKAYVPTVEQATDASVTLGSGAGGLTVTSATNTLDNLIPGVTLHLLSTSSSKPITLTVAADPSNASKAVQSFVQDYNSLITFIEQQTSYDAGTGTAGPLLGDIRATMIEDRLQSLVMTSVAGVNPRMSQLGALGITANNDGTLALDQTQLNNALSGGITGVTLNDVRNLFALSGSSTNPGVQFITGSDSTRASAGGYQVNVTQAAQQASITASTALAGSTTIDNTNNTFTINVDGALSSAITLASGTYSAQGLAQAVQAAINSNPSLAGRQVTVGLNGNQLVVTSATYGSSSKVSIGAGNALGALGFAGTEASVGVDVAGNFVVNGIVEPATGSGQILTGVSTNANTAGLVVRSTLTSAQLGSGPQATVTVSRGIASQVGALLTGLLDPVTGELQSINNGLQDEMTSLQQDVTRETEAMNAKQTQLLNEFTAMEQTISQLQSTSSFLSTQFASLLPVGATSAPSSSSSQSQNKGTLNA